MNNDVDGWFGVDNEGGGDDNGDGGNGNGDMVVGLGMTHLTGINGWVITLWR